MIIDPYRFAVPYADTGSPIRTGLVGEFLPLTTGTDGDIISSWTNTGTGGDATQAVDATHNPILYTATNTVNGHNTLWFTAGTPAAALYTNIPAINGVIPSVFFVAKSATASFADYTGFFEHATDGRRLGIYMNPGTTTSGNNFHFVYRNNVLKGGTPSGSSWGASVAWVDISPVNVFFAGGLGGTNIPSANYFAIGAWENFSYHCGCYIAEVLVYSSTLSPADSSTIMAYLVTKYAL